MDQKLLLLINREWTSPALDRVMAIFSSFDFWTPFLLLGVLCLAWRGGFRGRAFLLAAALSAGLSDGAISNPLKRLVNRPRPPQVLGGIRQVDLAKARPRFRAVLQPPVVKEKVFPEPGTGEGRSFPSSHTANTMAVAMAALLFFPRRAWPGVLFALLVAWSRIYTGSHWPSDIAASLFLGAGVGLLSVAALEFAWRACGDRWWPLAWQRHPTLLPAS
jgi:membrane-associated phospholipid phosphatase